MAFSKLSRSVEGRVVHITGAASGMGRATACVFADAGARLAISDLNEAPLLELEKELAAGGVDVRAWQLDVADKGQIATVVAMACDHFGGLDILVNNAGMSVREPIDSERYEQVWEKGMAVLLDAHMRLIRASLPWLRRSDAARIVNIASTEGLGATAGVAPYSTAKHGVIGLTRALAVELGPEGITVNCVCPGPIHTGITQAIPPEAKQKFARRRVALHRYGDPEEVAQATLSLSLPAASYITGVALPVDGGLTIRNA
ncbi:MAG: SDR family oxidoreductase [Gammaproteobacteria bacterium]|nr:SDR family oxidoreductase [Gammaproteobacteria bacterium]